MTTRLLVIGGDAAGMSAASQVRRLAGPDEVAITVLERGGTTSYAACGIPYWIGGLVGSRDALIARRAEVFRERHAIDVRLHHEALAVDPDARTVTFRDLETGTEGSEGYDRLLIATGARASLPPVEGLTGPGVHGVRTLPEGQALLEAIGTGARRAVVIGAGYIGLEMAEALQLRGLDVTVVDLAPRPMATLDPDLGDLIAERMRAMGIGLVLGAPLEAVLRDADGRLRAVVTPAGELEADLVVLGTGARPASELASAAGIALGPAGAIAVDERQRTAVEGVWAAGDCATSMHRVSGRPVWVALGTVANKQGRIAGLDLSGVDARFPGVLGTAITKVHDLEIARTGLGSAEAVEHGFAAVASTIEAPTRAHYYPGGGPMTVRTVVERSTGRLLGAQVVGGEGAGKRIDALAMAVWSGMTVDELSQADLAYAPPFAPVWDPVLIAARRAEGERRGGGDA